MTRVAAVLALVAGAAQADNAKLDEARRELAQVHYDRARALLVEALDAGGSSPAETREIYQLAARTAAALGQADVAEQFYRRWLALDPHAALGDGESPKLRPPFLAAQTYIQAHGGLVVTAALGPDDADVAVLADPLVMAAAAGFIDEPPVALDAARHAHLAPRAGRVAVIDARGNRLVELDVAPRAAPPPPPPPSHPPPPEPSSRTWLVFGIPAAAFTATAIGFGITALSYQNRISDDVERSGDHFASDVANDRDRARLFAYMSAGAMAAGIGFAIPAIHYYPHSLRATLLPLTSGIGISLAWTR